MCTCTAKSDDCHFLFESVNASFTNLLYMCVYLKAWKIWCFIRHLVIWVLSIFGFANITKEIECSAAGNRISLILTDISYGGGPV